MNSLSLRDRDTESVSVRSAKSSKHTCDAVSGERVIENYGEGARAAIYTRPTCQSSSNSDGISFRNRDGLWNMSP